MKKSGKYSGQMDLLKSLEKSPELTDFVMRNRISDTKKDAIIYGLLAGIIAFVCGLILGLNLIGIAQTKNIVEVQVSRTGENG